MEQNPVRSLDDASSEVEVVIIDAKLQVGCDTVVACSLSQAEN